MPTFATFRQDVVQAPILDVGRSVAAGFQAQLRGDTWRGGKRRSVLDRDADGSMTAAVLAIALAERPGLPTDTFMSLPLGTYVATSAAVRDVLLTQPDLDDVVLDVTGSLRWVPGPELESAVAAFRRVGARIAVGGDGVAQPELTCIVSLRPAIIRLGRDWVRDIDHSKAKRTGVEIIARLAGELGASILAEGVTTAAELRALVDLGVPLAQGPLIGATDSGWPEIRDAARTAPRLDVAAEGASSG
jgi:predicted signal transduction protein with EAL and GGDEF domain